MVRSMTPFAGSTTFFFTRLLVLFFAFDLLGVILFWHYSLRKNIQDSAYNLREIKCWYDIYNNQYEQNTLNKAISRRYA